MSMRVGIVGLGLIGRQRLAAIHELRAEGLDVALVGAVDPVAGPEGASGVEMTTLEGLLAQEPDWVVVATPHDSAVEVVPRILAAGPSVLVEKPLGRDLAEARTLRAAAGRPERLRVGFNYRFFAGVRALVADARSGAFGDLVSVAFVLGHGGSPGDEKSWKLSRDRAGGGCLIDPGVHVLDLARQLEGGQLAVSSAMSWEGFWGTGIEEECHLLLRGERVPMVDIAVSIVRWRSTFRMEVNGTDGYGIVEGRGRSYGPQVYRRGSRWGWQAGGTQAESEEVVVTSNGDEVFVDELRALLHPGEGTPEVADADEAVGVMELLAACRVAAL